MDPGDKQPMEAQDDDAASSRSRPARAVVVGGGLVGVCTAYYLQRGGMQVEVVESAPEVAMRTSFANAGRFCPTLLAGYPLARPDVLWSLATAPARRAAHWARRAGLAGPGAAEAARLREGTDSVPSAGEWPGVGVLGWGLWFLRSCTPARFAANNAIYGELLQVAQESTEELLAAMPSGGAGVDLQRDNLWLYGSAEAAARGVATAESGSRAGYSNWEHLDCDTCAAAEPSLARFLKSADRAHGTAPSCILVRDDFSVDARKFAQQVAALTQNGPRPVSFSFSTSATGLLMQGGSRTVHGVRVEGPDGPRDIEADYVVVCAGPFARRFLMDACGVSLPILGMRGCSIDLLGVKAGPSAAIADYSSGPLNFQATPLDSGRVRLVGFADLVRDPDLPAQDAADPRASAEPGPGQAYKAALLERAREVFPGMTWAATTAPWCGVRPLTPDFLPILGPLAPLQGLFVNLGHGANGWSLAAATGRLVAEAVLNDSGQRCATPGAAALTCEPFSASRFSISATFR